MQVTKYPQSCFKVEKDGRALLIDIGKFATEIYSVSQLFPFEAILITHQHADHIDPELLQWLGDDDVSIYANADVARKFPAFNIHIVEDKQKLEIAGFDITARDLPHCVMPDGSDGPPNTGYVIDGRFFHAGDGVEIANLTVDVLAAPIAGPSVSIYSAVQLVRSVQAKSIIPMHYDNPIFYNDPTVLKERFDEAEVIVLANGESKEI